MAARFLALGYPVYGEQRSRAHAQKLIDQGLHWCDTPREVAAASEVVFSSVPDDGVLEAIASGPDGVLAGLAAGKTWVDLSTVSPRASRGLAARVRTQGGSCSTRPSREASRKSSRGR
jgi:3-hydroxyisobutyrate dehydrogenase-like beta-hydroxyacid dehydrogenase